MTSKECLERLLEMAIENGLWKSGLVEDLENTIKQDLDKLEKLEKVIEILKNKQVHIIILLECIKANGGVELYNACVEKPFQLIQEEYSLLKEVLNNE